MKVLVLGGTGAMGVALVEILVNSGISVDVTSRKKRISDNFLLKYIQGDAHDNEFLRILLKTHYDCIVDFMSYSTKEFEQRVDLFLNNTKQYVFLSSSRVYADANGLITENSPRLLDVSQDKEYLGTDEYALAKARQENFLFNNGKKNWVIIRPYITYNFNRLQLGIFEKEIWLQRALRGKPIVFSKDVAECLTTLTYGYDVAEVMSNLIGKVNTLGQAFHITCDQSIKWMEVLNIYLEELKHILGTMPQIYIINDYKDLLFTNHYALKYDRLFNRQFDNTKVLNFVGQYDFSGVEIGLRKCLHEFFDKKDEFKNIDWRMEGIMDRICGCNQNYNEINGWKNKVKYFLFRNMPAVGNVIMKMWIHVKG